MQVLIKNPFTPISSVPGTFPSFWSADCLYMDKDFSFGTAISLTSALKLSPFLSLDPRIAFMVSQVDRKVSLTRGIGALGAVALHFYTESEIIFQEENTKLDSYVKEYLPRSPFMADGPFEQVVVFNENMIDPGLWEKLPVGGTYILASGEKKVDLTGLKFEAFGKLWPFGEPTEFGWKFDEAQWGLSNYQFLKIRKSGG